VQLGTAAAIACLHRERWLSTQDPWTSNSRPEPCRGSSRDLIALKGQTGDGQTGLTLASVLGDFVGRGQRFSFSPANALMVYNAGTSEVRMGLFATGGPWSVDLRPPTGRALAKGTYAVSRYGSAATAGLDVSGQGRGCSQTTGSLTVREAQFDPLTGAAQRFDASFSQVCVGATKALTGQIQLNASLGPSSVTPVPSNVTLQNLSSPKSKYQLVMRADGNLVLYSRVGAPVHAIWSSVTAGHPNTIAVLRADSNLVLYLGTKAIWSTRTNATHPAGTHLDMQDDGNLVLYSGTHQLWSSHIAGRP
jgi:hypothetical protein